MKKFHQLLAALMFVLLSPLLLLAVEDSLEPNNDEKTATAVSFDRDYKMNIFPIGDIDYLSFEIPENEKGMISISFSGVSTGICTSMVLLDFQNKEVAHLINEVKSNGELFYEVPKGGKYYLKVHDGGRSPGEGNWGPYLNNRASEDEFSLKLKYSRSDDSFEPNNEKEKAVELTLKAFKAGSVPGELNIPLKRVSFNNSLDGLYKTIRGTIFPTADCDWYSFTLPKDKRGNLILSVEDTGIDVSYHVQVFDEKNIKLVDVVKPNGDEVLAEKEIVCSGKYYIRIGDGNLGVGEGSWNQYNNKSSLTPYSLTVLFNEVPSLLEPDDSPDSAHLAESGKVYEANIFPVGDRDHYKFEVKKGDMGRLSVSLIDFPDNLSPMIEEVDAKGSVVNRSPYYGKHVREDRQPLIITTDIVEGTYYFRVMDGNLGRKEGNWYHYDNRSSSENYEIVFNWESITDSFEPNNSLKTASQLQLGKKYARNLFPQGDLDYYKLTLPEGSRGNLVVSATDVGSSISPYLILYGADEREVKKVIGKNLDDLSLSYEVVNGGNFFVCFSDGNLGFGEGSWHHYNNCFGDYSISVNFDSVAALNEPSDSVETAVVLPQGKVVDGTIFPLGDRDWYKIVIPGDKPSRIRVVLQNLPSYLSPHIQITKNNRRYHNFVFENGNPAAYVERVLDPGIWYLILQDGTMGDGENNSWNQGNNASSVEKYEISWDIKLSPVDSPESALSLDHNSMDLAHSFSREQMLKSEGQRLTFNLYPEGDEEWINLGLLEPGKVIVSLSSASDKIRPSLSLMKKLTDGTLSLVKEFFDTQVRGGSHDESNYVDLPEKGHYYLKVTSRNVWLKSPLALSVSYVKAPLSAYDIQCRTNGLVKVKDGERISSLIWPSSQENKYLLPIKSPGVLNISVNNPSNLPLELRLGKDPGKIRNILYLIGGRIDYDMFAHAPMSARITRLKEDSPDYRSRLKLIGKEETKVSLVLDGRNRFIVSRGLEFQPGVVELKLSGQSLTGKLVSSNGEFREVVWAIPEESTKKIDDGGVSQSADEVLFKRGSTAELIIKNVSSRQAVSLGLLKYRANLTDSSGIIKDGSQAIDRLIGGFNGVPFDEDYLNNFDTLVADGFTGPMEFFLDSSAQMNILSDWVSRGNTFMMSCPQNYSYNLLSLKRGGRIVSNNGFDGMVNRLIEFPGCPEVESFTECTTSGSTLVLAFPGDVPTNADRLSIHTGLDFKMLLNTDAEKVAALKTAEKRLKKVKLEISNVSEKEGFEEVGVFDVSDSREVSTFSFKKQAARFVRLSFLENFGADRMRIGYIGLFDSEDLNGFFGLAHQTHFLSDNIVPSGENRVEMVRGENKVNRWPSADYNGWFLCPQEAALNGSSEGPKSDREGSHPCGFDVLYAHSSAPDERFITLEKKIGKGTVIFDTQELGYSANREKSKWKVNALLSLKECLVADIPSRGGQVDRGYGEEPWVLYVSSVDSLRAGSSLQPVIIDWKVTESGSDIEPNDKSTMSFDILPSVAVEDNIYPSGDVDWFRVTLLKPSAINILVTKVSEQLNLKVELYSQKDLKKPLKVLDNTQEMGYRGPEGAFVENLPSGIYLIKIMDYFNKNRSLQKYQIQVDVHPDREQFEKNDSIAMAAKLRPGKAIYSSLARNEDKDFFYVEMEEGLLDLRIKDLPFDEDVKLSLYKDVLSTGKAPQLLYIFGNEEWPPENAFNLNSRLEKAGFEVTSLDYKAPETQGIWERLSDFDVVIVDKFNNYDTLDISSEKTERLVEDWVENGGRFVLLSPGFCPNMLSAKYSGGSVVKRSSQWDSNTWKADNLLDGYAKAGNPSNAWCSGKNPSYPQELVFAFSEDKPQVINSVSIYNTAQSNDKKVREFEILVSNDSADSGFKSLGTFEATQSDNIQTFTFTEISCTYIQMLIKSNYGNKAELQFGEFIVRGPNTKDTLFSVKPVMDWSDNFAVKADPTDPQAEKYGSGPFNGFGWSDSSCWFEGWKEAGFTPFFFHKSEPQKRALTLFKRLGKGILALDGHQYAPDPNNGIFWKLFNLIDLEKPLIAFSDGWGQVSSRDERLRMELSKGSYFISLERGAGSRLTRDDLTVIADFSEGEDQRNPLLLGHAPQDKASSIGLNSSIYLRFSEALNPSSVRSSSITVKGSKSGNVSFLATYDDETYEAVLKPSSAFTSEEQITVTVPAGAVSDLSGKRNKDAYYFSFQTGSMVKSEVVLHFVLQGESPYGRGNLPFTLRASGRLKTDPAVSFKSADGRTRMVVLKPSDNEGSFSGVIPLDSSISDGNVTVLVTGIDMRGNEVPVTGSRLSFLVDTTPPAPYRNLPLATTLPGGGVLVSWNGIDDDVYLLRGLDSGGDLKIVSSLIGGKNNSAEDLPPSDGKYRYALMVVDKAGNRSSPSATVKAVSDRKGPEGSISSSSHIIEKGKVNLKWESAGSDAFSYVIWRSPSGRAVDYGKKPDFHIKGKAVRYIDSPLDGDYDYHIAPLDEYGNAGTAIVEKVHLDTTVPVFNVTLQSVEPLAPVTSLMPISGRIPAGKWTFTGELNEAIVSELKVVMKDSAGNEVVVPFIQDSSVDDSSVNSNSDTLQTFAMTNKVTRLTGTVSIPAISEDLSNGSKDSRSKTSSGAGNKSSGAGNKSPSLVDGYLTWTGTSCDTSGNEGLTVRSSQLYLDRKGPVARIETIRSTKPWQVNVHFDEPLTVAPLLEWRLNDSSYRSISLKQDGWWLWTGTIAVDEDLKDLKDGEAQYRLQATDPLGHSDSIISEGGSFLFDQTPPGKVTALDIIAARSGQVRLSWGHPLDEVAAAFVIYRSQTKDFKASPDNILIKRHSGTSLLEKLEDDKSYFYRVSAIDVAGNIGEESIAIEAKPDSTPPGLVENLAIKLSEGSSVRLTWDAPVCDEGSVYNIYVLRKAIVAGSIGTVAGSERPDKDWEILLKSVENNFFVHRLTGDGSATYAVSAVDLAGNEGQKLEVSIEFDVSAPVALLELNPSSSEVPRRTFVTDGTVGLKLTFSEEIEGSPVLTYRTVTMRAPAPVTLKSRDGISFEGIINLTKGDDGPLNFAVEAKDSSGNLCEVIKSDTSFIVDTVPPLSVSGLIAKAGPKGLVELNWAPPAGEGRDAFFTYLVYSNTSSFNGNVDGFRPIAHISNKTSFSYRVKSDGENYYVVCPKDEAGLMGRLSKDVSIRSSVNPPPAPTNLRAQVRDKVQLLWKGSKASSYRIYSVDSSGKESFETEVSDTNGIELQPVDNRIKAFVVRSVDEAGNESVSSAPVEVSLEDQIPWATIETRPQSPVKGHLQVTLRTSIDVKGVPSLIFWDEGSVSEAVGLQREDSKTFKGTLPVTERLRDGRGHFTFSGESMNGFPGNQIRKGKELVIDRIGPHARVDLKGSLVVKPGVHSLSISMNELIDGDPAFYVTLPGEKPKKIELEKSESPASKQTGLPFFKGDFVIADSVKDGKAFFTCQATDVAGNNDCIVTGNKFFTVDTKAPFAPRNLTGKTLKGGVIELSWQPPFYKATDSMDTLSGYNLYRSVSAPESGTTTAINNWKEGAKLVGQRLTNANYRDYTRLDGQWYYGVASIDHAGWESSLAGLGPVKSVVTAPVAPEIIEAKAFIDSVELHIGATVIQTGDSAENGSIDSSSSMGTLPKGHSFNIYSRLPGFESVALGSITTGVYKGVPNIGGEYYFYASQSDSFGNESEKSLPVRLMFRKVAPVAEISLIDSKGRNASIVGLDGVTVKLTSSAKLTKAPQLFFSPPGGGKMAVPLIDSGSGVYSGKLNPPATAPFGKGYFSWIGEASVDGKVIKGVTVNSGSSCVIDVIPPSFIVKPEENIREFNKVSVFKTGTHHLIISASEDISGVPQVKLELRGREPRELLVEPLGNSTYRTSFVVTEDMKETDGHFLIEGTDRAGNKGTIITRGTSLRVDTIVPEVVKEFRVVLMPSGKVRADWTPSYRTDGYLDKPADRFELFRSPTMEENVEGLKPLTEVDFTLGVYDSPTADGVYHYAVRAIDRAGNIGKLSKWATVKVDRNPPSPPKNLSVRLTDEGVVELTWEKPDDETPLYYNAYISSEPIETVVGMSAMNERIPFTRVYGTPNEDGIFYFAVTAVDKVLNESKPSACQKLDYRSQLPLAAFKITEGIWLTDKTYEVLLTTSEPLAGAPEVVINSESGKHYPLTFTGSGANWRANLRINKDMPEGTYGFIFRGEDLQGNIGNEIEKGPLFHIDRTLPLPPDNREALPSDGVVEGGITLTWKTPKRDVVTEVPHFYNVYRSFNAIEDVKDLKPVKQVKVVYRNLDDYTYTDIPPSNGEYHFGVTSLDMAGNESLVGRFNPVSSLSNSPRAVVRFYNVESGDQWTDRIGRGESRVELISSVSLAKAPELSFKLTEGEDETATGKVSLTGEGKRWTGTFTVDKSYEYEQDGVLSFRGESKDGIMGNYIASGGKFVIDTIGPVAEVTIPSISEYMVNMETNKLEVAPVKLGRHKVELKAHKELSYAPELYYEIDGKRFDIPLTGFGKNWTGYIATNEDSPQGEAKLFWNGVDRQGNKGDKLAPLRQWFITDENFPKARVLQSFCTAGSSFKIDVVAPEAPINMEIEVRKLGVAVIKWDKPEGNPARYRLYRSLTPIGSVENLRPVKKEIYAPIIVDAPPFDGNWFYAVTAVDIGGNESGPSQNVNIFVDSIKPELKIKAVPSEDGFLIVLEDDEVPPELSLSLKFPGEAERRVSLNGDSGELKVIPNYRGSGKPAILLPQHVDAFNGRVEIIVHSPDPEGNIVDSTTTVDSVKVSSDTGGTVTSIDNSVTLEIPPGLEPVIPLGPKKHKRIDGYDKLFFISYANIPTEKSNVTTTEANGEGKELDRNALDPLPPGLEVLSRPYTINLNVAPSEPIALMAKASQADLSGLMKLTAKLRMKIPRVTSEVIEDPEYLKSRLKVLKWVPTTKKKKGKWVPVPPEAIVLDPETKELIVPADEVTTYVIVSEQTPPSVRELEPSDLSNILEARPLISALLVDKGTGIATGAENRIILRIDGELINLQESNLSQGDPTEVRVSYRPEKELSPGEHVIAIEVEDVVGNRRVRKWRFNIDNRAPQIYSVYPSKNTWFGTRGGLIVASADDPGGSLDIDKSNLSVGGISYPITWLKEHNLLVSRISNVADGTSGLILKVQDKGGKHVVREFDILSDSAPPELSAHYPKSGGLIVLSRLMGSKTSSKSSILAGIRVEDRGAGIDLSTVKLFVDGALVQKEGNQNVPDGAGYIYDEPRRMLIFPLSKTMTEGNHMILLTLSDKAGNETEIEVPFETFRNVTPVSYLSGSSAPEKGVVVLLAGRKTAVKALSASSGGRKLQTIYDESTGGIIVFNGDSLDDIVLEVSDRSENVIEVGISPSKENSWIAGIRSGATGIGTISFFERYKYHLLWVLNFLILCGLSLMVYIGYRKRKRLSAEIS